MTKSELRQFAKDLVALSIPKGLTGIDIYDKSIQLQDELFLEIFTDYTVEDRGCSSFPLKISADMEGLKVFAITAKALCNWEEFV